MFRISQGILRLYIVFILIIEDFRSEAFEMINHCVKWWVTYDTDENYNVTVVFLTF